MMDQLISRFAHQLKEAIEIGEHASISPFENQIQHIVMVGMGGSGIGGAFVANFIAEECKIPFIINSSYKLPAYVGENTLVIASSYSGNTEETLAALDQAIAMGANIICISSGGKMLEIAKAQKIDYITLPSGWPSPRACLGYSIVAQLYALYHTRLISKTTIEQIKNSIDLIAFEKDDIKSKAERIAESLYKKKVVIYTTDRAESTAIRWRQQINENSKALCWHHVIPEMNHNELVGWKSKAEDVAVIFLRHKDDFKKNQLRTDITKQIISPLAASVVEIYSKGQSFVEKSIYLVHIGDWVSWYLAQKNNVDASEIQVIDYLKSELGKVSL